MDNGVFGTTFEGSTRHADVGGGMRTLVIGLSGCSWNVLEPLLESGELPHLAALREAGAHGVLESVVPFHTGPAWASYATGATPSGHGIYDIVMPDREHELRSVETDDSRCPPYWKRIGSQGKRSVLVNFPLHQDGCEGAVIVNGWLTADESRRLLPVGRRERYGRLLEAYQALPRSVHDVDELCRMEEARFDLVRELFLRESWDHFFCLFLAPDWLGHMAIGRFLSGDSEARKDFVRLYSQLDRCIGWLVERADDALVAIVSEHGQSEEVAIVRVNTVLHGLGLVELGHGSTNDVGWRPSTARKHLPRPLVGRRTRTLSGSVDEQGLAARLGVDRTRSRAFSPTDASFAVYVQDGGGAEITRIRETLLELQIEDGKNAIDGAWTPERNRALNGASRLGLLFAPAPGVRPSVALRERPIDATPAPGRGCHQRDGIVMLAGGPVKAGALRRVSICDLAPTLLWFMGLPIPATCDGRVLLEAFRPTFTEQQPVIRGDPSAADSGSLSEFAESLEVTRRLKALGYI